MLTEGFEARSKLLVIPYGQDREYRIAIDVEYAGVDSHGKNLLRELSDENKSRVDGTLFTRLEYW